jgi:probable rRNA maturation factor
MASVSFYSADVSIPIKHRTKIRKLIVDLFAKERTPVERLSFIFCSDEYLLPLNKKHLNHDYYTDVITFDLSNPFDQVVGEVYLSTERIKENAKAHHEAYQKELLRVMIHGALHLCGYKDKTKAEEKRMRLKEEFYLQRFRKRFT